MKRIWIYLINPFLTATRNSYRMAARISTKHFSALEAAKADPYIFTLFTIYEPLHKAFMDAFNKWLAQEGLQKGATLNLNQLLRTLSNSKAKTWESMAVVACGDDAEKLEGLFPNGRAPFQTGTQTEILAAVKALLLATGSDTALDDLRTDVNKFNDQLVAANTKQKGSISTTGTLSDDVEAKRILMCDGQYANLGSMINKYPNNTQNIEQYFDIEALRTGQQVFFDHQVKPLKINIMVQHTFGASDQISLENAGPVDLKVYNADSNDAMPAPTALTLTPGQKITIPASNLGPLTNAFILAYNADENVKGQLILEIL